MNERYVKSALSAFIRTIECFACFDTMSDCISILDMRQKVDLSFENIVSL